MITISDIHPALEDRESPFGTVVAAVVEESLLAKGAQVATWEYRRDSDIDYHNGRFGVTIDFVNPHGVDMTVPVWFSTVDLIRHLAEKVLG